MGATDYAGFNWANTMPSLDSNGNITGGPDPYAGQADPSKGVDIRNPDGTWTHMDPHKDRNGNYINPTTFMSDSLPGGVAYAYPDTDEWSHIGRVFSTDRNRSIGKMLALVGGAALAGGALGGAGQGATSAVGDIGSEGMGISQGFLSPATEAAMSGAGGIAPAAADVMTVTAPALASGVGAGTAAGIGGGALTAANLAGATGGGEGADALMGDEGLTPPAQPQSGGFFSNIGKGITNSITNPDGSYNWANILKLGGTAASALGSLTSRGSAQSAPTMPAGWNDPATYYTLNRERTAPMTADQYATYGQTGGEHKFFTDPTYTKKAGGGNVRGPGSGREDKIDALLSDGEYVMDAESVAMLGDGSVDEGSRRLDQLRMNLRKHKGAALAQGKFSPSAKRPEEYMGVQRKAKGGLTKLLDAFSMKDIPRTPIVNNVSPEDIAQMVRWLRANNPDSDVLKHFDAAQTPDLRGRVPPSPADLADNQALLDSIRNTPPVQKAKGGLTAIQGGIPKDPAMRLEQLANAQRTAAALRAQAGELTPASPAIQGDRAMVEAARNRLKMIRSMADATPSPLMKAEGGSVKALSKFADRLEESADTDEPALID